MRCGLSGLSLLLASLWASPALADLPERAKGLATAGDSGMTPVGEVFTDSAAKKHYKRDWNAQLEKDSCYFIGVRYITASRAIITGTFEPIVAIVGSFLFLGDLMAPLQVMGAILVITAIAVLQVRREEGESIECTQ